MRAHAALFMGALGAIVGNLHDVDCWSDVLRAKVKTHARRGIGSSHFQVSTHKWLQIDLLFNLLLYNTLKLMLC